MRFWLGVLETAGFGRVASGMPRLLNHDRRDIKRLPAGSQLAFADEVAGSPATVTAFGDGVQAQRRRISAKSRLGEKLTYVHDHWDGLQTFLHDGRAEIGSNRVENLIRPIARNRKTALFAGHDEGGIAWGRIASLSETCKINGMSRSPLSRPP